MDFLVIRKTFDYISDALREVANGTFFSFFLGSSNRKKHGKLP